MGIADLRAVLPRRLQEVPLVLYMHENQAAYPAAEPQQQHAAPAGGRDVHFALTNFTSMLAADRVIWNSQWNRDSFLAGLGVIWSCARDSSLDTQDVGTEIRRKSTVIWPPVEPPPWWGSDEARRPSRNASKPVRVVWPHRWEHDKGPDELLAISRELTGPLNLRWTILGEQYRKVPESLRTFEAEFGPNGAGAIDQFGYVPDKLAYWNHLRSCDWVLSTAQHEFFGIAVVEALLAGCLPWLPPRLSYSELLPDGARGLSPQDPPTNTGGVVDTVQAHLTPAVAQNAVTQLDLELENTVRSSSSDIIRA